MAGATGALGGAMKGAAQSKMSNMINNTDMIGDNVAGISSMMQPQEQDMQQQQTFQAQNSQLQQDLQQQNLLANNQVMQQLQQPQERPWWMQYDEMM